MEPWLAAQLPSEHDVIAASSPLEDAPVDSATSKLEELLEAGARERRAENGDILIHCMIPTGAALLRFLTESKGVLRWWLCRSATSGLEVLRSGMTKPLAVQQLGLESLRFNIRQELAWYVYEGRDGQEAEDVLGATLSANSAQDPSWTQLDTAALHSLGLSHLASLVRLLEHHSRTTGIAGHDDLHDELVRRGLDVWGSSLIILKTVRSEGRIGDPEFLLRELDASVVEYASRLDRCLETELVFEPLLPDLDGADLILQGPSPIVAAPCALLSCGSRPLFEAFSSVSSILSATLLGHNRELSIGSSRGNGLLSVTWPPPASAEADVNFGFLHSMTAQIAKSKGWMLYNLCQQPPATVHNVCSALSGESQVSSTLVVIAAHGDPEIGGVLLSDGTWDGDDVRLEAVDVLILVSCAVGRVRNQTLYDFDGMYVRLAGCGARSVLAARWPIDDHSASLVCIDFLDRYMGVEESRRTVDDFERARTLNACRREYLSAAEEAAPGMLNVLAAFDLLGRG